MKARIRDTGAVLPHIHDTGPVLPRVDAHDLAAAFGATETRVLRRLARDPHTLASLRKEILGRLASHGGRPSLEGTTKRRKIPFRPEDWRALGEVARTLSRDLGRRTTTGQVASALIRLSLAGLARATSDAAGTGHRRS